MNESDGPIVAAVREARTKLVRECNYDLRQLAERLRQIEAEHADRICSSKKKSKRSMRMGQKGG